MYRSVPSPEGRLTGSEQQPTHGEGTMLPDGSLDSTKPYCYPDRPSVHIGETIRIYYKTPSAGGPYSFLLQRIDGSGYGSDQYLFPQLLTSNTSSPQGAPGTDWNWPDYRDLTILPQMDPLSAHGS